MNWILQILVAIDQLGNALAGGNPDALISARVAYFSNKVKTPFKRYWKILEWVINFAFLPIDGPVHCLRVLEKDTKNKFIQGSDLARALLGLIIIFASFFIAIFLRIAILIIPSWHYKSKQEKNNTTIPKDDDYSQNT